MTTFTPDPERRRGPRAVGRGSARRVLRVGRMSAAPDSAAALAAEAARARGRLARGPVIERTWTPDREAMTAALRVVLGLPRVPPPRGAGGSS